MGTAGEDLTEPSVLEMCCCGPMFLRESKGLCKQAMISTVMKSHTNEHTVQGRPTLKDVKRFRNGSVCKPYERSIYERNILSEFIKNHVIPKEPSTGAINSST